MAISHSNEPSRKVYFTFTRSQNQDSWAGLVRSIGIIFSKRDNPKFGITVFENMYGQLHEEYGFHGDYLKRTR